MIEFEKQYSMKNGNKVTKKNWHRVVAISLVPTTCLRGWPVIDEARKNGGYYCKWKLCFEKGDDENTGFIFREINANTGIDGHHPTFKQAIWNAITEGRIACFLEDEPATSNQQPVMSATKQHYHDEIERNTRVYDIPELQKLTVTGLHDLADSLDVDPEIKSKQEKIYAILDKQATSNQ